MYVKNQQQKLELRSNFHICNTRNRNDINISSQNYSFSQKNKLAWDLNF